jgi:hypothetical protein
MPNLLKECVKCKQMRNADTEYHFNGAKYADGTKKKRKDCVYCCRKRRSEYFKDPNKKDLINQRRRRTYGEDRKSKNRRYALKALYGITPEQYNEMLLKQDNKCACCKIEAEQATRQKLYIDHCHATKQVRGLLCAKCNSAIGLLKEDTAAIQNAIEYLNKSKK